MMYFRKIQVIVRRFRRDESGASTVEMVIAMALGLALGLAATQMIGGASKAAVIDTSADMEKIDV